MVRRLILIRHGQTTYNATGRMQGHLDTKLSAVGYEQAKGAAAMLRDKNISAIVCSDLIRARETARVIGEELGLEPSIDARLRETNLGDWQGMSSVEVDEEFPGARAIWRHDPTWRRRRASRGWTSPSVPAPSSTSSCAPMTGARAPCSWSDMEARFPR